VNHTVKRLLAVALLAGLLFLAWRLVFSPDRAVRNLALARREIATRVLAEAVAGELPGKQALVISNPFTQQPGQPAAVYAFEEAGVAGLRAGFGQALRLQAVAFPELSPAALHNPEMLPMDPDTTTPLSFLTAEGAWDTVLRNYPGADVFISLIGVPLDLPRLEVWRQPKPQFALLLPDLRMIGGLAAVREAFRTGKVVAAVLNKPGAPPETAALARDYRAEFDTRFLLVTARNLDEVVRAYPRAF
jgi:hypothetical protein